MKHVLCITTFPPRVCGIATFSYDLIQAINKKFKDDYIVDVCAVESNIEQQIEIKKGRGRPKRYDEGCKQHNKDVKYFLNYYYENKNKTITCSLCGKENVKKLRLALHKKSKCCINAQIKNELEELKKQNTLIN